ncbi:MAG: HAD-IIB family hydrolase [Anaerolineae bacterium]
MDSWLLVSDVDDTLLGDDEALRHLANRLAGAEHITTVWNSSRPCASLRASLAENEALPTPDYLVGALGTEIEIRDTGERHTAYDEFLDKTWDRARVAEVMDGLGFTPHPPEYLTRFKLSYDIPGEQAYLKAKEALAEAGLKTHIIFSGGHNLDIIPEEAGKGRVVAYLHDWLGIPAERVIVAGDSGNDVDMFIAPYRGIVVGNASDALKQMTGDHIYHARAHQAEGVLEGLIYWKVLREKTE